MGRDSKIEWTHHTFNPWMGCTKVSEGCKFCYAEDQMDTRWGKVDWGPNGTRVRTAEHYWKQPLKWNEEAMVSQARRRVFCASLADVYEDWEGPVRAANGDLLYELGGLLVPEGKIFPASLPRYRRATIDDLREDLFRLIERTPHLDWMLLTKRPENIEKMVARQWLMHGAPANVWLGFSAENQKQLDNRWGAIKRAVWRLGVRIVFVSAEPLLGALDLGDCLGLKKLGDARALTVGLVIVGGESGKNARPMHPDWVRSIRDQCRHARKAFFFKQWGEWKPISETPEEEYSKFYVSKRKAEPGERQSDVDDVYGRRCTVDVAMIRYDGKFGPVGEVRCERVEDHLTYTTFRVGKKNAGRELDGKIWEQMPGGEARSHVGTQARSEE